MTTVAAALAYKERLQAVDPSINYLMTLYLHESITPDVVREAKRAGIAGIKVRHPQIFRLSEYSCSQGFQLSPILLV